MRAVRIWYKKSGLAVYISHLDLYRTMSRAIKRARIPIWYTQGYNPKPYLNFLLPLPLGIEATCEPIDIKIDGEMPDEEISKRLNDALPDGLEIVTAKDAESSPNEIACCSYDIFLEFDSAEKAQLFTEECKKLIKGEEIIAEKMGKKGRKKVAKQVNLYEKISKFNIEASENAVSIQAVLHAGNLSNLNPFLLIEALKAYIDIEILHSKVIRKSLLKSDFSEFE